MNGTIARIMVEKRFGFIRGEDGKDYFFHMSGFSGFFDDLAHDFEDGRKIHVTFDAIPSPKGPRADNVNRVDGGV